MPSKKLTLKTNQYGQKISSQTQRRVHETGSAGRSPLRVVGSKPLPRTELTKKLWDYIKKNGLQDKKDRKMINADAALKAVFGGRSKVSMFEMTKLVSGHVS